MLCCYYKQLYSNIYFECPLFSSLMMFTVTDERKLAIKNYAETLSDLLIPTKIEVSSKDLYHC